MRDLIVSFTKEELNRELSYIITKDGDYNSPPNTNKIVLQYQWKEFYKHEIEMWKENKQYKKIPLQLFIYLNRMRYIHKDALSLSSLEILRSFKIAGIYTGKSHFSPFWIKKFISEYNIRSIYDFCGGWGHRLLGSYKINYIYNDINTITYENCKKIVEELNIPYKKLYNNDSSKFIPSDDYECVFTCPPYFNKEIYTDVGSENLSKSRFIEWWGKSIKNSLKPSVKFFVYVISNDLKDEMNNVCLENGLIYVGERKLSNKLNHFQRKKNNICKGESLQIFKKINMNHREEI